MSPISIAHIHSDLSDQLTGALVLFFDNQLELLVGDISEVDQDLAKAAKGHEKVEGLGAKG